MNPSSSADVNGVQILVSSIYNNLFDRSINAALDPGAQFWVHALLTGQVALGQAILDIANGATGVGAQVVLNKVIAADYFFSASDAAGLGQSSPSATLLSTAHMALIGIGADAASVAVAEAKIDGFFQS